MREIRTSGLMSGEGKRSLGRWLKPPRPSSTPQIKGKKRHILVDTLGLLLSAAVHSADIQDRDGASLVLDARTRAMFPFILRIFADAGYQGPRAALAAASSGTWMPRDNQGESRIAASRDAPEVQTVASSECSRVDEGLR
jgi:hypothetical protein